MRVLVDNCRFKSSKNVPFWYDLDMPVTRTDVAERNNNARTLFHLYYMYKTETARHLNNPDDTTLELNALYRNQLVPRINELVKELKVAHNTRAKLKLPYVATPFVDLFSIKDVVRRDGKTVDDFKIEIDAVQSRTKDIVVAYGAEADTAIDEVERIKIQFSRLYSTGEVTRPATLQLDKPVTERANGRIRIVSRDGRQRIKFSKAGSIHGELLELLITYWGIEYSRAELLQKLEQKTTKHGHNWITVQNAVRHINRCIQQAGYPIMKIRLLGNTFVVSYSDT